MSKRFVWAVDADGKGRYVHIDAIAIASPSRDRNGYVLKTMAGRMLGLASADNFNPDDYED